MADGCPSEFQCIRFSVLEPGLYLYTKNFKRLEKSMIKATNIYWLKLMNILDRKILFQKKYRPHYLTVVYIAIVVRNFNYDVKQYLILIV